MKVYKFKSFEKPEYWEYSFDIIQNNRIWCSKPDSLNDTFEFKVNLKDDDENFTKSLMEFLKNQEKPIAYSLSANRGVGKEYDGIIMSTLSDMSRTCRELYGVVSYSAIMSNELWERYGGSGNGICIEFDLDENLIGNKFHLVEYSDKVQFSRQELFDGFTNNHFNLYRKFLCTKNKIDPRSKMNWSDEKEIRVIGEKQDVLISTFMSISNIYLGNKLSPKAKLSLENLVFK